MKMIKFLLLALFVISCTRTDSPVFEKIDQLRITSAEENWIDLSGTGYFYNPNKRKIFLKDVNMDVFLDDLQLTTLKENIGIMIPPEEHFSIPFQLRLNKSQIGSYFKSSSLKLMLGGKLDIKYSGYIRIKSSGIPIRIRVDGKKDVRISEILEYL